MLEQGVQTLHKFVKIDLLRNVKEHTSAYMGGRCPAYSVNQLIYPRDSHGTALLKAA